MDFSNKNLWLWFRWGDTPVYITQSMLATWIVMGGLILFAVFVRIRVRRFTDVPKGFQNLIETAVETMQSFARSTMGEGFEGFGGIYFAIFAFILFSNYSGLLGLRPPTADLATAMALALTTFVLIHATSIRRLKGGYLRSYIEPYPVFLPINLISEASKPISLAFRLFGNLLGGVIIVGMLYQMLPVALRFVLPAALHLYFDVLVGALQAFIFTVLSMTFIQQMSAPEL